MSENGAKPSVQALDAFSEWMRRVESKLREHDETFDCAASLSRVAMLERRIEALEAKLPDNTLNPKHWRVEPDGTFDATVQLRRDVGTLVRAAREVIAEIDRDEGVRAARVSALRAAVNIFAGDYT